MMMNERKNIRHKTLWSAIVLFCLICLLGSPGFVEIRSSVNIGNPIYEEDTTLAPVTLRDDYAASATDYAAVWNRTYGGFVQDCMYDIVRCQDGGLAMVGYTNSFTAGDYDIWVIRTDDQGNVMWTTTLGTAAEDETGHAIIECLDGDFVIAGYSLSGTYTNARVYRIDANGEELWDYDIGDALQYDHFYSVIETGSNSILAVGNTASYGAGAQDVLAVCLDRNGNGIWTRTYGGASDDLGKSVVECSEGGYAILASTHSKGAGDFDFWLLRIDVSGNLLWDKTYGGANSEEGAEIITYADFGYVIVGKTESEGDPLGDFWVIRVDLNGDVVWDVNIDNGAQDFATDIILSQHGGFAVVGIVDYSSGVDDAQVVRFEPNGDIIWIRPYGGGVADYAYGIVETSPDVFAVAGCTNSYGAGAFDAWLFLIPGPPEFIPAPSYAHFEYGEYPYIELYAESAAEIDSWWLTDTTHFNITGGFEGHATIYTFTLPAVDFYDLEVHVNNTAGFESCCYIWLEVYDSIAPHWIVPPENQTVEYGEELMYLLNAEDLSGLAEWTLSGSSLFEIDNGLITSTTSPPVGEYLLTATVMDPYYHQLSCNILVSVIDTVAPIWNQEPKNQTITYGDAFVYDLNASDLSDMSWSVGDPSRFTVDWQGLIRNLVPLAVGDHGVDVFVSDAYGNTLHGAFTITVESATTSGTETHNLLGSAIPFAAGIIATVAVASVVYILGRHRAPSK
jgi:hypothetical protein